MPQAQQRQFPGYGVVYPDGVRGIKVVKTFTQGSTKIVNPDGSVSYSTPPPVIHELYGGGFSYADGSPVTNRDHLELITDIKMKEKAIQWYETHGKAIVPSQDDIPPLDQDGKQRPDPAFILSNELPLQDEAIRPILKEQTNEQTPDNLSSISQSIASLVEMVKKQGEEIAQLKVGTPEPKPKKRGMGKQAETMKARWADPTYREMRKNKAREKRARRINGTSQTDQKV